MISKDKIFIIVALIILALFPLPAVVRILESNTQTAQEKDEKYKQLIADEVINEMQYIEDPRTGLCFAYIWRGGSRGGPAMALVPKEKIPPELLRVGKKSDNK